MANAVRIRLEKLFNYQNYGQLKLTTNFRFESWSLEKENDWLKKFMNYQN